LNPEKRYFSQRRKDAKFGRLVNELVSMNFLNFASLAYLAGENPNPEEILSRKGAKDAEITERQIQSRKWRRRGK
jgi:hypothetical protein